ncbi:hypothetical protein K432DRAFT_400502 [Lepidopterella palustris CBS 459.81]|uniref:Uncharacterized protein n=1 Tax=Lepidopterella palustris CBS 459.81 TaxID=1314670 RepID=A0A8E2JJX9_9PEZI|nr:hypothetical protein K432DRAFT_400502 [Lepidopterella palustris CBS 459.81]
MDRVPAAIRTYDVHINPTAYEVDGDRYIDIGGRTFRSPQYLFHDNEDYESEPTWEEGLQEIENFDWSVPVDGRTRHDGKVQALTTVSSSANLHCDGLAENEISKSQTQANAVEENQQRGPESNLWADRNRDGGFDSMEISELRTPTCEWEQAQTEDDAGSPADADSRRKENEEALRNTESPENGKAPATKFSTDNESMAQHAQLDLSKYRTLNDAMNRMNISESQAVPELVGNEATTVTMDLPEKHIMTESRTRDGGELQKTTDDSVTLDNPMPHIDGVGPKTSVLSVTKDEAALTAGSSIAPESGKPLGPEIHNGQATEEIELSNKSEYGIQEAPCNYLDAEGTQEVASPNAPETFEHQESEMHHQEADSPVLSSVEFQPSIYPAAFYEKHEAATSPYLWLPFIDTPRFSPPRPSCSPISEIANSRCKGRGHSQLAISANLDPGKSANGLGTGLSNPNTDADHPTGATGGADTPVVLKSRTVTPPHTLRHRSTSRIPQEYSAVGTPESEDDQVIEDAEMEMPMLKRDLRAQLEVAALAIGEPTTPLPNFGHISSCTTGQGIYGLGIPTQSTGTLGADKRMRSSPSPKMPAKRCRVEGKNGGDQFSTEDDEADDCTPRILSKDRNNVDESSQAEDSKDEDDGSPEQSTSHFADAVTPSEVVGIPNYFAMDRAELVALLEEHSIQLPPIRKNRSTRVKRIHDIDTKRIARLVEKDDLERMGINSNKYRTQLQAWLHEAGEDVQIKKYSTYELEIRLERRRAEAGKMTSSQVNHQTPEPMQEFIAPFNDQEDSKIYREQLSAVVEMASEKSPNPKSSTLLLEKQVEALIAQSNRTLHTPKTPIQADDLQSIKSGAPSRATTPRSVTRLKESRANSPADAPNKLLREPHNTEILMLGGKVDNQRTTDQLAKQVTTLKAAKAENKLTPGQRIKQVATPKAAKVVDKRKTDQPAKQVAVQKLAKTLQLAPMDYFSKTKDELASFIRERGVTYWSPTSKKADLVEYLRRSDTEFAKNYNKLTNEKLNTLLRQRKGVRKVRAKMTKPERIAELKQLDAQIAPSPAASTSKSPKRKVPVNEASSEGDDENASEEDAELSDQPAENSKVATDAAGPADHEEEDFEVESTSAQASEVTPATRRPATISDVAPLQKGCPSKLSTPLSKAPVSQAVTFARALTPSPPATPKGPITPVTQKILATPDTSRTLNKSSTEVAQSSSISPSVPPKPKTYSQLKRKAPKKKNPSSSAKVDKSFQPDGGSSSDDTRAKKRRRKRKRKKAIASTRNANSNGGTAKPPPRAKSRQSDVGPATSEAAAASEDVRTGLAASVPADPIATDSSELSSADSMQSPFGIKHVAAAAPNEAMSSTLVPEATFDHNQTVEQGSPPTQETSASLSPSPKNQSAPEPASEAPAINTAKPKGWTLFGTFGFPSFGKRNRTPQASTGLSVTDSVAGRSPHTAPEAAAENGEDEEMADVIDSDKTPDEEPSVSTQVANSDKTAGEEPNMNTQAAEPDSPLFVWLNRPARRRSSARVAAAETLAAEGGAKDSNGAAEEKLESKLKPVVEGPTAKENRKRTRSLQPFPVSSRTVQGKNEDVNGAADEAAMDKEKGEKETKKRARSLQPAAVEKKLRRSARLTSQGVE